MLRGHFQVRYSVLTDACGCRRILVPSYREFAAEARRSNPDRSMRIPDVTCLRRFSRAIPKSASVIPTVAERKFIRALVPQNSPSPHSRIAGHCIRASQPPFGEQSGRVYLVAVKVWTSCRQPRERPLRKHYLHGLSLFLATIRALSGVATGSHVVFPRASDDVCTFSTATRDAVLSPCSSGSLQFRNPEIEDRSRAGNAGRKVGMLKVLRPRQEHVAQDFPRIRWARLARGESGSDLAGAQRLRAHHSRAEGVRRAVFPEIS